MPKYNFKITQKELDAVADGETVNLCLGDPEATSIELTLDHATQIATLSYYSRGLDLTVTFEDSSEEWSAREFEGRTREILDTLEKDVNKAIVKANKALETR